MKAKPRYLTKSLFKSAIECPTKLFYKKKKDQYLDESLDDPFLEALAKGGFQVGALAQCYYPEGVLVDTLDHEEAVAKTEELLNQNKVTIFEAALKHNNKFIRVDILVKNGNVCELIEVKSKSVDPESFKDEVWNKKVKDGYRLGGEWKSYIFDIAFQMLVAKSAKPDFVFKPYLMCADKTKCASVDGLNQKFLLRKDLSGQVRVILNGEVSPADLGERILVKLDLSNEIDTILKNKEQTVFLEGKTFTQAVEEFEKNFSADRRIWAGVGAKCKTCEFRSDAIKDRSGFEECWTQIGALDLNKIRQEPFVFDLWDNRSSGKQIENGVHLLRDLGAEDINHKEEDPGSDELTRTARQLLQIDMVREGRTEEVVLAQGLAEEMDSWVYPLHFIDFETCTVAIPFSKGRRPYEQLAFQFSHHMMDKEGKVTHKSQFLFDERGEFPNFHFIRALKESLEQDQGTIFRYADHENTVLMQIHAQLEESAEPDRESLMEFIRSITTKKPKKGYEEGESWEGERSMVDLLELVKRYYYHPRMKGSNSLKAVLPSVLNSSQFLKDRYSKPIYGKGLEISSLNYLSPKVWVKFDKAGDVLDPYQELESILDGYSAAELERLLVDEDIKNGGSAMMAYAMMQFVEMSEGERQRIKDALLHYCELDTLAMVMLVEHWKWLINARQNSDNGRGRLS